MNLTELQRSQAHALGFSSTNAEALLTFIGLRPDLAVFPLESYTPAEAELSDSNFVETFDTAVAAAQAAGGGIIQIPAGSWTVTSTLQVTSAGRNAPIYIQGAGLRCTTFVLPVGFTGTLFYLTGLASDGAADLYYNGGLADFTIAAEADDVSTTGTGIKIASCIATQFLNLEIRSLSGGSGFKSVFQAPDSTNQYCFMWNVTSGSNKYNFNLTSFVNCQGYGVNSASAYHTDFLCDDVKATFFNGSMQSSGTYCVHVTGGGGCMLVFHGYYYEGAASTIFKLDVPSTTQNLVSVYNFHNGGSPAIFADTDVFNHLSLMYVNFISNASTILKARQGASSILVGCRDPVELPAQFDLDTASKLNTVYMDSGATTGAEHKFVTRASTGVTGPSLFVDSADGALKFKGAGGTLTTLAPT